jgi:hypothetical protein
VADPPGVVLWQPARTALTASSATRAGAVCQRRIRHTADEGKPRRNRPRQRAADLVQLC